MTKLTEQETDFDVYEVGQPISWDALLMVGIIGGLIGGGVVAMVLAVALNGF